mgnify:CR=1 FL=1
MKVGYSSELAIRRKASQITQAELADNIGVDVEVIRKIEIGEYEPNDILKSRIEQWLGHIVLATSE